MRSTSALRWATEASNWLHFLPVPCLQGWPQQLQHLNILISKVFKHFLGQLQALVLGAFSNMGCLSAAFCRSADSSSLARNPSSAPDFLVVAHLYVIPLHRPVHCGKKLRRQASISQQRVAYSTSLCFGTICSTPSMVCKVMSRGNSDMRERGIHAGLQPQKRPLQSH